MGSVPGTGNPAPSAFNYPHRRPFADLGGLGSSKTNFASRGPLFRRQWITRQSPFASCQT